MLLRPGKDYYYYYSIELVLRNNYWPDGFTDTRYTFLIIIHSIQTMYSWLETEKIKETSLTK